MDTDNSQDELRRAFASMFGAGGGTAQAMELWRTAWAAMMAPQAGEVRQDMGPGASKSVLADPLALMIRVNALLLSSSVQYWLGWQELLSTHAPVLRRTLEAIGAGELSGVGARETLLRNLRSYVRDAARLPYEHCRRFQDELCTLDEELFADAKLQTPRRLNKYKD
jgi:hypothetical protein